MEIIVEVGSNVTLNCSAIAFPEPDITWTLDANMHLFGRDKLERLQSSSIQSFSFLTLESVALEDNGIYNCFANNSIGSGDVSVTLTVLGKGVYINHSKQQELYCSRLPLRHFYSLILLQLHV